MRYNRKDGPIRIAQVLNIMDSGGIEAVVMNYYRHVDRSKVQFDFFVSEKSKFPQREELEQLGAGIYTLPSISNVFAYQKQLRKIFRTNQYEIVHVHMSTLSVFALYAAKRSGVKVRICHNHSTANAGEGLKTVVKYLLRPFCKLFATDYFACGQEAGRWMYGEKAMAAGAVHVMSNAIDCSRYEFNDSYREEIRSRYNIPADAFVVGHIGRFVFQKNHDYLIDIFEQLLKVNSKAYLLLVGEGDLVESTLEKVKSKNLSDHVIYIGVMEDAWKFYSAIDAFCLPSFYEGLPVVGIEAQANGLPCVFSDEISSEILQSKNVELLPLGNTDKWVQKLMELHRDLVSEGLKSNFDIFHAAQKTQDWYMSVIDSRFR